MTKQSDEENTTWTETALYLLKTILLLGALLTLVGIVGNPLLSILALPGFLLAFVLEALRKKFRELVGWPVGEGGLWWMGAVLVAPTALAVLLALDVRLSPTSAHSVGSGIGIVVVTPVVTLASFLVLAGADRLLCMWSLGARWAGLALIGLVLGGGLLTWSRAPDWVRRVRILHARHTFLEAEALVERWAIETRVTDVDAFDQKVLVRNKVSGRKLQGMIPGDSILTINSFGKRTRAVKATKPRDSSDGGEEISLKGHTYLQAAQLDRDPFPETVHYGFLTDTLRAFDHGGTLLWTTGMPLVYLESVAIADLDGDDLSEIVAGSRSGGGLRLLSPSGERLRADTTLEVTDFRIAAERLPGNEDLPAAGENLPSLYVATREAIRRYRYEEDPARSPVNVSVDTLQIDASRFEFAIGRSLDTPVAADSTAAGAQGPDSVLAARVQWPKLVGFTLTGGSAPVGSEHWRRYLPSHRVSLEARGPYLAAVGEEKGHIYVIDLRSGEAVAVSPAGRTYEGVEWVASGENADGPPVLVGWTEEKLVGLRLPEAHTSGRKDQ